MQDTNLLEDQPIAWTPTPEVVERAQLTKFMRQVGVSTWDELYEFSISDVEQFTEEVLKFLDIKFDPPYEKLLDTSGGVEFPVWFSSPPSREDAENTKAETRAVASVPFENEDRPQRRKDATSSTAGLNITTMCLDRWQTDDMKEQPAVVWEGEEGGAMTLSYAELLEEVTNCADKLCDLGIVPGDAVGIHLPMIPETVVSLLAINRIGAIAVPVFSGYGIDAISSRMEAVGAKAIFTSDGFPRRGKPFDMLTVAARAVANVPTIRSVIVTERNSHFGEDHATAKDHVEAREARREDARHFEHLRNDLFAGRKVALWRVGRETISACDVTEPAKTSAEDPLIILYTSGTTGKPKGVAHTHASFPIKAAQDMAFGTDVGKGTRISWYTDIGWMMGPWLIYGALINGATICIYDGAPDYPTPDRMWEFVAKHKVEILGISPTLIRALAASEERSADTPVRMDAASVFTESETSERRGWYHHKLPHFDGDVTQFITFRLADSLPRSVLERLKRELEKEELSEDSEEYRKRVEDYLDRGAGECILRDPAIASTVEEVLLKEHGSTCNLKAWVIMPNHAHVLLSMLKGHDLAGLMKRVKGISARRINKLRGKSGKVWQEDYFDRYIRDGDHFARVNSYIKNNPVVSGLSSTSEDYRFGSAWQGYASQETPAEKSADTLVRLSAKHESDAQSSNDSASMQGLAAGPFFAAERSADTPVHMSAKHESDAQSSNDSASMQGLAAEPFFAGGTGDADKSVRAPFERHDLSSLRAFASTGEPWNPAPWWWLFEKVGNSNLPIINYSGGTEISGGILMGNMLLPQKPCSFPAPCPGMDVDILDDEGKSVEPGKVGELVIKQPSIGMARGFWQERERYLETYWSRFKNIWVHGDWAMRDADGHYFILGRSDDTLKVAGKRVGPAEVESLLVAHPQVIEAAVIGVPNEKKGTAMVAFAVLTGEQASLLAADDEEASKILALQSELKSLVARDMGKPLAPSRIHFVSALPKTRNAKVMRRVIRSAYLGEDPGDLSALENPGAVEEIQSLIQS